MKSYFKKAVNIGSLLLLFVLMMVFQNDIRFTDAQESSKKINLTHLESARNDLGINKYSAKADILNQETEQPETDLPQTETQQTEKPHETKKQTEADGKLIKNTVIGYIMDFDTENVFVLADSGEDIVLPLVGAEIDLNDGFFIGNLIAANYTYDSETEGMKLNLLKDSDDTLRDNKDKEIKKIKGRIKELGLGKVIIVTEEGKEITFRMIYTPVHLKKGLEGEKVIEIYYYEESEGKKSAVLISN